MNGSSAFIKEAPERSLAPSAMWRHGEKMANCEPESRLSDNESAGTLILNFSASELGEMCLLFKPSSLLL